MKKIKIKIFSSPDKTSVYIKNKGYSVALGNGLTAYATNKKDIDKILARTGKFLTENLEELNYIYVQIFSHYRAKFLFLPEDFDMMDSFIDLEHNFKKCITIKPTINSNHFTFSYLFKIIGIEKAIIKKLSDFYEAKLWFSDLRYLNIFYRRLDSIKEMLDSYGL